MKKTAFEIVENCSNFFSKKRINFYFVINTHVFELVSFFEGSNLNLMGEWEFSFFIKCFHR
jgi:hypothetical protein